MKVIKIQIKYDENNLEKEIKKIGDLPKENELYVFYEYTIENVGFVKIGIESVEAHRIQLMGYPHIKFKKSSNNFWYMVRTQAEVGLNVCGSFTFEAYDKNNVLLEHEKVIILPKTLSLAQYESMKSEAKELLYALDRSLEEFSNQELEKLFKNRIDVKELDQLISNFRDGLEEILECPAESLQMKQETIARDKIKRWTARALSNSSNFKGAPKIKAESIDRSVSIPEHGMLKTMLENIHSLLKETYKFTSLQIKDIENAIINRNDTIPLSQQVNNVTRIARNKINRMRNESLNLKVIQSELLKIQQTIDRMKDEVSVFNVAAMDITETHLFLYEPRYVEVLNLYEKIIDLKPTYNLEKVHIIDDLINSPKLFEIWTLLQLYKELIQIKFIPEHSITDYLISCYKEKGKSLSGASINFLHLITKDIFKVVYEPTIQIDSATYRPDFYLSFTNARTNIQQNHTLDAKYKPYSERLFLNTLIEDLEWSCIRYKNAFSNSEYAITSATLVHSDYTNNTSHWNINFNGELPYTYSHFCLAPGYIQNLNTYIKRIIHQYNGDRSYCPSCGNCVVGEATCTSFGYPYKWTFICECEEVWVDNTCKSEFKTNFHPESLSGQETRLLKYAMGNYNKQVENIWDVHCQVCNRNVNGVIHTCDILGNTIE